ncbi:hypothetical protein CIW52_06860 [Mycolicibacterium sp. P9-64]|uniref:hypothetical protein n=1 Tax=Mycolicibacterium sp. P9-64 TaxID=2024612 RepID=UPI0011EBB273|nr:hypothetical protein [Mycolicibacterium sp. P9-64]KAA0085606.1 hypothetical protein CIW52_06860 [Mycolicibacterium sp. P9-64]
MGADIARDASEPETNPAIAWAGAHPGRSGGRSGAAGYRFQDQYVALHLARMLIGVGEQPLREVLWEKKALRLNRHPDILTLIVDDVALVHSDGAIVLVEVKQSAPAASWTINGLFREGVLPDFWAQWASLTPPVRNRTTLQLASARRADALNLVIDNAKRARNMTELLGGDGSAAVHADTAAIIEKLGVSADSDAILPFLQHLSVHVVPDGNELTERIEQCLPDRADRSRLAQNMITLVERSKNADRDARASYTAATLARDLSALGTACDVADFGSTGDGRRGAARLLSLSEYFVNDITATLTIAADNPDTTLYVRRDIEDDLVAQLQANRDAATRTIIVGPAGHGKTTLLWALHNRLRDDGLTPVLVSASWLTGSTPAMSVDDLLTSLRALSTPVLLLDTADLLLHDEMLRLALLAGLDDADAAHISWVLSTRPEEATLLPLRRGKIVTLEVYHVESELPEAVARLVRRYCPERAPADAHTRISAAVARGLPVAEVCLRPLLLRLLFDLAAPEFPVFAELDVTGLFLRFWSQRVAADQRAGIAVAPDTDLSLRAGGAGVALLAEGSPTAQPDVLAELIDDVLAKWARPTATGPPGPEADAALLRRGILQRQATEVGFLHQTLFEFAAAKGLILRDGGRSTARFLTHLDTDPADLFAGAVFEQYLILLGRRRSEHERLTDSIATLLRSPHSPLRGVGYAVWAHYPALVGDATVRQLLGAFEPDELRRFADIAPTVALKNLDDVLRHVQLLWSFEPDLVRETDEDHEARQRHQRTRRMIALELLERFARRDPTAVAGVVSGLGCVGALLASDLAYVRSQTVLTDMIGHIALVDPASARTYALEVIAAVISDGSGRETIRRLLALLARPAVWNELRDNDFLISLESHFASRNSDARALRSSLGAIYASEWGRTMRTAADEVRGPMWSTIVDQVCRNLEDDDQSPLAGAKAVGVAILAGSGDLGPLLTSTTVQRLLTVVGPGAPRELARGAFPLMLSGTGLAADLLRHELSGRLAGLPVSKNNPPPGPKTWAAVARDSILSQDVSEAVCTAIVTGCHVTEHRDMWLDPEGMLAVLSKAAVGGHRLAAELLEEIADQPDQLDAQAQGVLLDFCGPIAVSHPRQAAPAAIALALKLGRVKPLEKLTRVPGSTAALSAAHDAIQAMIDRLLASSAERQAEAARLWQALITMGVLTATTGDVIAAYDATPHPKARAALINTLAAAAADGNDPDGSAVAMFGRILELDKGLRVVHPTAYGWQQSPQVREFARMGWLRVVATDPATTPECWPTLRGLLFRPTFFAKEQVNDIAGVGYISHFITGVVKNGYTDEGIAVLIEAAACVSGGPYAAKQQANASNRWLRAIEEIVATATSAQIQALLLEIDKFPAVAAQLVISTLTRTAFVRHRDDLNDLLNHPLPAKARNVLQRHLQRKARELGTRAWPDILDPA